LMPEKYFLFLFSFFYRRVEMLTLYFISHYNDIRFFTRCFNRNRALCERSIY
jgi:hypothetical protein